MNKIFKFRFLGIVAFFAMIAVFSVAAMFLWNALMPNIFALPTLNYWQMAGLVILARILFGGTGHLGQRGHGGDGRLFHNGNPLREKWMNMSEDERKEFMRSRGGLHPFHDFFNEPANKNGKDVPDSEGGKRE